MGDFRLSTNTSSPYCSGIWDEKTNSYIPTTSIDTINCCMESCSDHIIFCYENCNSSYAPQTGDKQRCYNQCDELIRNCESGCMENPSVGMTNIYNCAKESGCGEEPNIDKKCVSDKKTEITTCCEKNCLDKDSPDCQKGFCDDFYTHLLQGRNYPLSKIKQKYSAQLEQEKKVVQKDTFPNILYITTAILFLFGISTMILILKMK
jgi:hypothetical protein